MLFEQRLQIGAVHSGAPCQVCDPANDRGCSGGSPACRAGGATCVECTGNAYCGGGTPFCVAESCVECRMASDCNDANECTTDSCSGMGTCSNSNTSAGSACSGGVCDGSGSCVACIDDSAGGVDTGCNAADPHCLGGSCVECVNDGDCPGMDLCFSGTCA